MFFFSAIALRSLLFSVVNPFAHIYLKFWVAPVLVVVVNGPPGLTAEQPAGTKQPQMTVQLLNYSRFAEKVSATYNSKR